MSDQQNNQLGAPTMTNLLVFSNPGEIDILALTTLGVNVKEGASPIGFFGTGSKYAIATILRLGGTIVIQSGLRRYVFSEQETTIRGKDFGLVCMEQQDWENGEWWTGATPRPLGFTTELGKHWLPWMAYRELWSNAKDEGGGEAQVATSWPSPVPGLTHVVVSGEAMLSAHWNRSEWLLQPGQLVWESEKLQVFRGESRKGFYHGIKVLDSDKPMAYTYNLTGQVALTEDRTMSQWTFMSEVLQQVIRECNVREVLVELVLADEANAERSASLPTWITPGPGFLEIGKELVETSSGKISGQMKGYLTRYLPKPTPSPVELRKLEQAALARALGFLAKIGHPVGEKILVVESLGSQWQHGAAQDGKIWLPRSVFGKGVKFLASTILEEHLHCRLGLRDESRELQDWLFDRVVSLGEELTGELL